jgi:peptide/nickel transport system substrate-binding protein
MMRRLPSVHRAALAMLTGLAVVACGGDGASGGRTILRVAYDREIDVLNPFTSQNLVDISFSMIEGLVTTDDSGRYVPVLAATIPTEENGLVTRRADGGVEMTWPLREGVLWHDGVPFTSADVCFTWQFVVDPKSETYNREQYTGIVDCQMPDDHTVVFRWDGAYAYYAGLFEAILPKHVLNGMTAEQIVNYEPYNRGPKTIGTGPFRFAEWKAGEYIRVVRNERYWRGPEYPGIDEVVWAFIPDANTRLNALKSGQYHYGQILPVQVREMAGLAGYQTHLIRSNSVMHFGFGIQQVHGRSLFEDLTVRQAIFHAIDRPAIARQLMEGTVEIANSTINPGSPYHHPSVTGYQYDPGLSRRLLDQAGWTPGSDGVRRKGGDRLAFVMLNRAGASDRISIAQVIQAQLKDVGIEVTFETLEAAAWNQRWRRGQWEAIVSAWFLPADPSITGLYACDGANNMTGFCDPSLDRVLKASDRALGFEQRKQLLDEAQEQLARLAWTLPLYYNVIPEVVSTRVTGYRGSGTNFGSFWNLYQWTLVD